MSSSRNRSKLRREPLWSSLGSAVAMACLFVVGRCLVDTGVPNMLVASMGASAVLIFCVPHGELSGAWAVLGGHVISAGIGVTALYAIPDTTWAGVTAVGMSIFSMQLLRCLHPPGGATALSAVVAGKGVVTGYAYVAVPVLINVVVMLAVAYIFHFPKRAYPLPKVVTKLLMKRWNHS